jgi:hypothetical protein
MAQQRPSNNVLQGPNYQQPERSGEPREYGYPNFFFPAQQSQYHQSSGLPIQPALQFSDWSGSRSVPPQQQSPQWPHGLARGSNGFDNSSLIQGHVPAQAFGRQQSLHRPSNSSSTHPYGPVGGGMLPIVEAQLEGLGLDDMRAQSHVSTSAALAAPATPAMPRNGLTAANVSTHNRTYERPQPHSPILPRPSHPTHALNRHPSQSSSTRRNLYPGTHRSTWSDVYLRVF